MPTETPNETSNCHKCSQQQLPSVNILSRAQSTTAVHDAADTSPRTNAQPGESREMVGQRHQRTPGTDDTAKGNTRQLPEIWQTHNDAQHSTPGEERHANAGALHQRKHVRIWTPRGRHLTIQEETASVASTRMPTGKQPNTHQLQIAIQSAKRELKHSNGTQHELGTQALETATCNLTPASQHRGLNENQKRPNLMDTRQQGNRLR
mmetsp:Transcript_17790/g.37591  ORF Transcript_17790/g.37591 Transcript_17790/m.37591 type:complete len:207 (+) Transcript_17790:7085-7705(+)